MCNVVPKHYIINVILYMYLGWLLMAIMKCMLILTVQEPLLYYYSTLIWP